MKTIFTKHVQYFFIFAIIELYCEVLVIFLPRNCGWGFGQSVTRRLEEKHWAGH